MVLHRVALLSNPAAGRGLASFLAREVQRYFFNHGVDVIAVQGASSHNASQLVHRIVEANDVDALVVVGGDGLINTALQSLALSEMPLGIIPAGTGNDHARGLGLPTSWKQAAQVVLDGHTRRIDIGRMTQQEQGYSRFFGTIACAGFDSLVTQRANSLAFPRGKHRYTVAAVREFMAFRPHPTRLTIDDEHIIRPTSLVAVGNTSTYGGGMAMCPHADPTDGLFDITVLGEMTRREAVRRFHTVFTGDVTTAPQVTSYRARTVRIDMPGVTGFADGEPFATSPIDIEVVDKALTILAPATA